VTRPPEVAVNVVEMSRVTDTCRQQREQNEEQRKLHQHSPSEDSEDDGESDQTQERSARKTKADVHAFRFQTHPTLRSSTLGSHDNANSIGTIGKSQGL
jgi:hypothetical protein